MSSVPFGSFPSPAGDNPSDDQTSARPAAGSATGFPTSGFPVSGVPTSVSSDAGPSSSGFPQSTNAEGEASAKTLTATNGGGSRGTIPPRRPPLATPSGDGSNRDVPGLPSAQELEQTLQRLVRRVAMMIQAEKCVFLLLDPDRQELVARPPALGFTLPQVRSLHMSSSKGLSGRVFESGEPALVSDITQCEPRDRAWLERLQVRNLIAYPLVIEQRDEQERVAARIPVGVLHVINKRGGSNFTSEDLRLLSIMARQVTAVIANAQVYLRLNQEKEQLEATLQSLLSGVVMVESSGQIVLLNPAAKHIFGLFESEVIGRHYTEVIGVEAVRDLLRESLEKRHESQKEIELPVRAKGGALEDRIFQAQTAFVRDAPNPGAPWAGEVLGTVVIFNDITEIRNVERMKTAFVSTVSHELRTPLTSIKGFISTLINDTEGYYDNETRREFYDIIDSECDRLRSLIEDLLNVSRIESGRALQMNWGWFEPLTVIERVLQAQRSYTDKHTLKLESTGSVPEILGDSDKFNQMLTNLVSNAIKYSPSGGNVTVGVSAKDDTLRVSVSDQGIGIPADRLSRVFEKFERIDNRDTRQAGGTGIGLFLVKHLVERHEGRVWVESEEGQGSSFIFEIPIEPPSAQEDMRQLADAPRGSRSL